MDRAIMLRRPLSDARALIGSLSVGGGAVLDDDIAEYHAYMDMIHDVAKTTPSGAQLSHWMLEICAMSIAPYSMIAPSEQSLAEPVEVLCAKLLKLKTRTRLLAKAVVYSTHKASKRQDLREKGPSADAFFREIESHVRVDIAIGGCIVRIVFRGNTCTSILDGSSLNEKSIVISFKIPPDNDSGRGASD